MRFTREDAERCAQHHIKNHYSCGGCHADGVCGMGQHQSKGLAKFLKAVDPDGKNIAVIGLGPTGPKR